MKLLKFVQFKIMLLWWLKKVKTHFALVKQEKQLNCKSK